MGAMGDVSPIQILNGREVPQAPLREQVRAAYKGTATKSIGNNPEDCYAIYCNTFLFCRYVDEIFQTIVMPKKILPSSSTPHLSLPGWAKNFAVLTALFGGVDCVIEKYRCVCVCLSRALLVFTALLYIPYISSVIVHEIPHNCFYLP